jgi:hypothetical protein
MRKFLLASTFALLPFAAQVQFIAVILAGAAFSTEEAHAGTALSGLPIVAVFDDPSPIAGGSPPNTTGFLVNSPAIGQNTLQTSPLPYYSYANDVAFLGGTIISGAAYSATVNTPNLAAAETTGLAPGAYGVGWASTPSGQGNPTPGCYSGTNCGDTSGGGYLAFRGGPPTPTYTGPASALQWGIYTPPPTQTVPGFSELDFFGAAIPTNTTQPFNIGTLTFYNGTSDTNTLIYGATISFYAGSPLLGHFLGTDQITITTTANQGLSIQQDSDWLNICGPLSNVCGSSINAIEDSGGGTGVTVDLMGSLIGDPMLMLDSVSLAPGQSPDTNGFVGNNLPLAAVPEPAALALFGAGLLGLGFVTKRRN